MSEEISAFAAGDVEGLVAGVADDVAVPDESLGDVVEFASAVLA